MDKIYVNIFRTYNDSALYEFDNIESAKKYIKRSFAKEMDYLASKGEKVISSYCNGEHAEIRLADNESFASWNINAPKTLHKYRIPVIVEGETLEEALKYLQTVVRDDEIDIDEARKDDGYISVNSRGKKDSAPLKKDYDKYAPPKETQKKPVMDKKPVRNNEDTFITSKAKEIDDARKKLDLGFDRLHEETKAKLEEIEKKGKDLKTATGKNLKDTGKIEKVTEEVVDEEKDDFYNTFLRTSKFGDK